MLVLWVLSVHSMKVLFVISLWLIVKNMTYKWLKHWHLKRDLAAC